MSFNRNLLVNRRSLSLLSGIGGPASVRNKLLAVLPPDEYESLRPYLSPVALAGSASIYNANDYIQYLYFPETAVLSLSLSHADGASVEVAMVGIEGLAGISALLKSERALYSTDILVAGSAQRIEARRFAALFQRSQHSRHALLPYFRSLLSQVSSRSFCNYNHPLCKRLSAWLLMIDDRVGASELRLTHDFIAGKLGARRAGITHAAKKLQREGVLDYRRGRIKILDRRRLESSACDCYKPSGTVFEYERAG